jgi:hypothetical protein
MHVVNERRAQPRAPLAGRVLAFIGDFRVECRAIDISTAGIAIVCPHVQHAGQFLRLNFCLGDGSARWFDADGVVARVATDGADAVLGVQFVVIEGRTAHEVHVYVEQARDAEARRLQQEPYLQRAKTQPTPPRPTAEYGRAAAAPPPPRPTGAAPASRAKTTPPEGPSRAALAALYRDAICEVEGKPVKGGKKK